MKHLKKSTFLLASAALSLAATSQAAEVSTDPVGYVSTSLNSGYTPVGITFVKPAEFSGTGASATATTIELSSAPSLDLDNNTYYVEITSGDNVGDRIDIASVAGSTVTFDFSVSYNTLDSVAGLADGTALLIRPHYTVGDFSALIADSINSDDAFTPAGSDQILIFDGSFKTHIYYSGAWYENFGSFELATDKVLAPGFGFFYHRNPSAGTPSTIDVTFTGSVRMNNFVQRLRPGYQFVASGYPIDASPSDYSYDENLEASPNFVASESDLILTWDNGFKTHLLYDDGNTKSWYQNFGSFDQVDDDNLLTSSNAMFVFIKTNGQVFEIVRPF